MHLHALLPGLDLTSQGGRSLQPSLSGAVAVDGKVLQRCQAACSFVA